MLAKLEAVIARWFTRKVLTELFNYFAGLYTDWQNKRDAKLIKEAEERLKNAQTDEEAERELREIARRSSN